MDCSFPFLALDLPARNPLSNSLCQLHSCLDLGLLASRILREYIFVAEAIQFVVACFSGPGIFGASVHLWPFPGYDPISQMMIILHFLASYLCSSPQWDCHVMLGSSSVHYTWDIFSFPVQIAGTLLELVAIRHCINISVSSSEASNFWHLEVIVWAALYRFIDFVVVVAG